MIGYQRLAIPVTLVVVAFFIMVAFQTVQLVRERGHLGDIRLAQEPTVQEGAKLRQQLDSLGAKTAALALPPRSPPPPPAASGVSPLAPHPPSSPPPPFNNPPACPEADLQKKAPAGKGGPVAALDLGGMPGR